MNNPFDVLDARLSNIETLLLDIKHESLAKIDTLINSPSIPEFPSVNQICKHFGCSRPTVYAMFKDGRLTKVKRGSRTHAIREEVISQFQKVSRA